MLLVKNYGIILRYHKIRSTFYTKRTLCILFCKPKDKPKDKNIAYKMGYSNCKAVYFSESKWSLKLCPDEHKRFLRNYNCDTNEIEKH